jgi:hypothetical protein
LDQFLLLIRQSEGNGSACFFSAAVPSGLGGDGKICQHLLVAAESQ